MNSGWSVSLPRSELDLGGRKGKEPESVAGAIVDEVLARLQVIFGRAIPDAGSSGLRASVDSRTSDKAAPTVCRGMAEIGRLMVSSAGQTLF
jgi:hypothetical protein